MKQRRADLAHRVREVREDLYGKYGAQSLADALDLPLRTWANYQRAVVVPAVVILKLIETTRVSPRWLLIRTRTEVRLANGGGEPTSVVARADADPRVTAACLTRNRRRRLVILDARIAPARSIFGDEDPPMMDDATYFERLAANVARLARHPHFPAKQHAVDLCLEEIDDLCLAGRLTADQAGALRTTLMGSHCRAA